MPEFLFESARAASDLLQCGGLTLYPRIDWVSRTVAVACPHSPTGLQLFRDVNRGNDAARIAELEREVRELRRANEVLKTASAFFAAPELDRRIK
ncbi:hypothetical protein [Amycolatopsis plumensis]|uniref:Transposase n=1 Tax=Amycolatopsis plumensis TaxID=236508 RepID=A0ABV5U522_9PSEU